MSIFIFAGRPKRPAITAKFFHTIQDLLRTISFLYYIDTYISLLKLKLLKDNNENNNKKLNV